MKTRNLLIAILTSFLCLGMSAAIAQSEADEIVKKMDKLTFAVKDKTVVIKMVLLNTKSQKEKIKEGTLIQKGATMKLFRYTAPESDAGIATLSLPNKEIYVYLPMFKKPKKITNLAESNTFNKSDFSVGDMSTRPYAEEYRARLINTSDTTYVVDLIPINEDSLDGHIIAHINAEHFYPEQLDFYDKKNRMVKQSVSRHIKVSGFWVANMVSMEDLKKNHKTTIYMSDIKINQGLEDELFTLEKLVDTD